MNFGLMSTSGACKEKIVVINLLKDLTIERSISCQRQLQPAHSRGREPWQWRRRGRSVLGRFPAEPEQRSSRPDVGPIQEGSQTHWGCWPQQWPRVGGSPTAGQGCTPGAWPGHRQQGEQGRGWNGTF